MPRSKRSEEAKVLDYFNSANEDRARLLLDLAKAAVDNRFGKKKLPKVSRRSVRLTKEEIVAPEIPF